MAEKKFFNKLSQGVFGKTSDSGSTGGASLEEENKRLRRAVSELSILNDLAITISGTTDPQEIVHKLVDRLMRAVGAEQATVSLADVETQDSTKTQQRVVDSSSENPQFHIGHVLLGAVQHFKGPLVINDPRNDERFKYITWDPMVRNLMCAPLMVKSKMIGIIAVFNKKGGGDFTEEDQRLLPIIAMNSATIIENGRLNVENAGMQEQLRLAYDIWRKLLPAAPPEIPGYDVAGISIPALALGGDYYDFIQAASGDWAVCLGDVSGKGLPAALLVANLQATLRGQTLVDSEVRERIERSNKLMHRSTDVEKFATLFYGILKVGEHSMTFVNAGHEPPFVFAASGERKRLESGGLAIAVIDDFPYVQETIAFAVGDVLVIYSDGVTDATNLADEPFEADRLAAVVEKHLREPASIIVDHVVAAVSAHSKGAPQLDDITVVVVKRMS
jgi:sigma-B regulation protein RsbU (phosphoserine phosphatase)